MIRLHLPSFSVPQGSILCPVLFNLYIVDIIDNISCNSLQYADDTTLYRHFKLKNLKNCIEKLESDLQTVSNWALQNSTKIFGVHFDENLTRITHVNNLIKSSHATLRSMRQFKWFTHYKEQKTMAETLILSNLIHCIPVYSQLRKYLIGRLQRTQNTVAGYVLGRYAKESDFITTLGWLPVQEMMEFAIVKCTFSALNDPKCPKYLPIKLPEIKRTPRLENEMMVGRGEKNTFGGQAHDMFNDLPKTIRVIKNRKVFIKETKRYYRDKVLARSLFFNIKLTMVITMANY